MKLKASFLTLMILTLAACSIPVDAPPLPTPLPTATSQPTLIVPATLTPIPALTQLVTPTSTLLAPLTALPFCDDPRGRELINSLSAAISSKDGQLLSSLVSPSTGLDVRYYRDGNVVIYDVEHAKFIFETTFQADWGISSGSGEPVLGSFQEIILPSLQQVFTPNAVIECNQIKVGGATYQPIWPYEGIDFFSVYYPGIAPNGGLDWQTWVVGMENVAGSLYLSALIHFEWEP